MTGDVYPSVRVAVVQDSPVFLDRSATIDKVDVLVRRAAEEGADVVIFGESFVAGYPIWANVLAPVDHHPFFEEQLKNAVEVPGPDTERLSQMAVRNHIAISIGVNEKSAVSMGTMWNSNIIFDENGILVNHRRKLVPTWTERLTYAAGDGSDLAVVKIKDVNFGSLICGENTNTLARFGLLAQGENIHIATYPPSRSFQRVQNQYNLTDAIRIRAAAHSFEGKVYTAVSATLSDPEAIGRVANGDAEVERMLVSAPPPASMIIDPWGNLCAGPLVADHGMLVADCDLSICIVPKLLHDITGAYNRFDVFELTMNQRRLGPIRIQNRSMDETAILREPGDSDSGDRKPVVRNEGM